jgi:hypothetical protein
MVLLRLYQFETHAQTGAPLLFCLRWLIYRCPVGEIRNNLTRPLGPGLYLTKKGGWQWKTVLRSAILLS